jgi:hypothetical protein
MHADTAAILRAKISVAHVARRSPPAQRVICQHVRSNKHLNYIEFQSSKHLHFCLHSFVYSMAPAIPPSSLAKLARRALVTTAPALASHHFERRGLTVNHTQGVTLGVICAYVVIIALLWNLPYVRWVLWPFKVC